MRRPARPRRDRKKVDPVASVVPVNQFQTYNIHRELDWRAKAAVELVRTRKQPKFTDDETIRKYRKFLLEQARLGPQQEEALWALYPEIHGAHSLRRHDMDSIQFYVEAHILARESDSTIAEYVGMLPGAVKYYEELFYNVRDKLNCPTWILRKILGPTSMRASYGTAEEIVTKLFAYYGGPIPLRIMMCGFNDFNHLATIDGARHYMDEQFMSIVAKRAAIIAHTHEIDEYSQGDWLALRGKLVEIVRVQARSEGSSDGGRLKLARERFADQVQSFFAANKIRWRSGESESNEKDILTETEKFAAEPRAHEFSLPENSRKQRFAELKKIPALGVGRTDAPDVVQNGSKEEVRGAPA